MRNQFFLLTVLAVAFWTGRGDQPTDGDNREDFYLTDMEEDLGSGSSYFESESSQFSSSFSSYDSSGETEILVASIHLNKMFIDAYNDPESPQYMQLETNFILTMGEALQSSPIAANYISTTVLGFSPGSVQVDFELEVIPMTTDLDAVLVDAFKEVITDGINAQRFDELSPNATSLVIMRPSNEPEIVLTTTETIDLPVDNVKTTMNSDPDKTKYRPTNTGVEVEDHNIFEMILGDPIIIAAIVGGIIVILLSIILLFLFVVYRLKKKDEGSYSLDEPAKSKDPTAYWKETKEFYA